MKTTLRRTLVGAVVVSLLVAACGPKSDSALGKLIGRWQRSDSEYVVVIRSVNPDGTLDAGYFNPQPIKVARAVASEKDGGVTVVIELRDVNYPGSTYTLNYDPKHDVLAGTYYQAVARETYDISFSRVGP